MNIEQLIVTAVVLVLGIALGAVLHKVKVDSEPRTPPATWRDTFKLRHESLTFLEAMRSNGFTKAGTFATENCIIYGFVKSNRLVWLQMHKDGTFSKAFLAIDENRTPELLRKLAAPPDNVTNAEVELNNGLKYLANLPDKIEVQEVVENAQQFMHRAIKYLLDTSH